MSIDSFMDKWVASLVALTPGLFIKKKLYTLNTRQTISVIMISFLINPGSQSPTPTAHKFPQTFHIKTVQPRPPLLTEAHPPAQGWVAQEGNGEESSNNVQLTRDK